MNRSAMFVVATFTMWLVVFASQGVPLAVAQFSINSDKDRFKFYIPRPRASVSAPRFDVFPKIVFGQTRIPFIDPDALLKVPPPIRRNFSLQVVPPAAVPDLRVLRPRPGTIYK